jgi:hypothetical protein
VDVVSVIGLGCAAVAAWGAVTTVRLTQYMIRDADLRRLLDGVVAMKHAAAAIEELGPN